MSGTSGFARALLGALSLVFLACGEPDDLEVHEGEQTKAFCDASCTRDLQCGRNGSLEGCMTICETYVTGLENIRPEGVEIAAECILDIPCSKFHATDAFLPCWERAERQVEPTQSTRRFCLDWSARWFECGSSYPVEQCESDWAINSAGYLERMSACTQRSCDSIEACAQAVQAGTQ